MTDENELLAEARKKVENLYGAALAKKASNRLLIDINISQQGFAESSSGTMQPFVFEFGQRRRNLSDAQKIADNLRQTSVWSRLQNALESISSPNEGMLFQASLMLRQFQIKALRDDFYKSAAPIIIEIENSKVNRQIPSAQLSHMIKKADRCWLNRSVRGAMETEVVAEMAHDPKIQQIDLPRMLEAEISVSTKTIGGEMFRASTEGTGKGVVVAVIDTEIDVNHTALKGSIIQKGNYTKESWGNPDSHGTAVAGIIASKHKKYTGIAPGATIYNYKVLATNRALGADDFGGSLAIQQALEDGVHIANCSWGAGPAGDGTSREARACNTAWTLGMTIVKSAGNYGPNASTLTSPADADGVIVVGATDQKGIAVQDYSSRGPTPKGKLLPHLVAPSGTLGKGLISCLTGGGFGNCGYGTSYAAPHVTGMLALLIEQNDDLMPDDQRELILSLCAEFDPNDVNTHGRGIPSLARFVSV